MPQNAPPQVLIHNVSVFDGHKVLRHQDVLVSDGKIGNISRSQKSTLAGAEIIPGEGRMLLPGLIDAHVHISSEDSLRQSLALGVTTDLDLFTSEERLKMMKRVEREDPLDMSDVRSAGIGATAPGGHPTELGGPPFPTLSTPAEAQAFVDQRIAEGSDYIKIIYDDLRDNAFIGHKIPMLNYETLSALVRAAHRRHKLALVHIGNESEARDAIRAGADGLAHIFFGRTSSADFGRFARVHHVFVIPTLVTLYSACGIGDGKALMADPHLGPYIPTSASKMLTMTWPSDASLCNGSKEAMHELIAEHVPVLAGTDAPVPGTTYGASLHGEVEDYVNLGMTPLQALATATSAPAHYFHLSDRGVIRPGARADLLLVGGDPTHDILATRNIICVLKRGQIVVRRNTP